MEDVSVTVEEGNRRSGRDRKSTLTYIDGYAVKRENNYSVTASEYIMGNDGISGPPSHKRRATTSIEGTKRPKKVSPHEILRVKHNEHVRDVVAPKAPFQMSFLSKHVDLLQDFCEDSVIQSLRSRSVSRSDPFGGMPVTEVPKAVQATLRDYQLQGLQFMVDMHCQNLPMILGDEMGLGKTLQTISLLCWLKESEGVTGPSLVVCPLSVLSSWCQEMTKWAPSLKYFRLHASNTDDQLLQKNELHMNATQYDVILTTYDMAKLTVLRSLYTRLKFHYLVLDEGHKIKGHETQISQAVRSIHCGNKLLLTGTPLQNNMVELWSLLNFLYPHIFTTMLPFETNFNLKENIINKDFLKRAQKLLDLFMLRRLKYKVDTVIPPKLETKVYCPLSKTQTFWYKSILMKDLRTLANCEKNDSEGTVGTHKITMLRSLFMQLRKCCNHPFVFEGAELDMAQTTLEELVAASGKLSVLDMLLQSLCQKKHRAVLFSQFTSILDIIEDYCRLRGWKYVRLDGSTDRGWRNYYINRFNEPNSPYFLFLVSTKSGGMGLNLQTADTCILFDSDWNPQSDIQAMGRVHRIGQTKTVHIYRLVSSGTVEERMLERAEKKLLLEMVNRETEHHNSNDDKVRSLSAQELFDDIKFGSEAVFGASANNSLPTWNDIHAITNRARKHSDSVGKIKGGASQSTKTFDEQKDFTNAQVFGGVDFRKVREEQKQIIKNNLPKDLQGIGNLWHEISQLSNKRARKSRIMLMEGKDSGYGLASIPVLVSNNYELQKGESSVFDRELKNDNKKKFCVLKKKKGPLHDNQDFCQVCGDGGDLVLCSRCPCSVHLECVGLKRVCDFLRCTHHNCAICQKGRVSAGGILFPCNACANSYCEDCLPKHGVTFLDRVERFDKLGFDPSSAHVVYILCGDHCRRVAQQEFGYIPPPVTDQFQKCPEPIDISFGFGDSVNLEDQISSLMKAEESKLLSSSSGTYRPRRAAKTAALELSLKQTKKLPVVDKTCEKVFEVVDSASLPNSLIDDSPGNSPPSSLVATLSSNVISLIDNDPVEKIGTCSNCITII